MKSLGHIRDAFVIYAAAALLTSCAATIGSPLQGNREDAKAPFLPGATFSIPSPRREHERVLWSFTRSGKIGEGDPLSSLILDNKNALYGTFDLSASFGDGGGVYKLTPAGSAFSKSTLYGFGGGSDGKNPAGPLIVDQNGSLYGTTVAGGGYGGACGTGCGTVFKLTPSRSRYSERILYRFAGSPDGAAPFAGLIFDDKGALYGTTFRGGSYDLGAVFKLTPSGSGYSESILYNFSGGRDGAHPYAGLLFDKKGALYGTTSGGGYNGSGSVFELMPSGSGYSDRTLYEFRGGDDGASPVAGLIFDKKGSLYGTTAAGGRYGLGTVFKLLAVPSSQCTPEEILISFSGRKDGKAPTGTLILNASGELYGTTSQGGRYGFGTAFKLKPSGPGYSRVYSESVLHNFNFNNGAWPRAGLTFGSAGGLYGTTSGGGNHGYQGVGTVFELAP